MSQKQIITVPFTGKRTVEGWRGQEWYDHRYKIFTKYTLNSLKNQTDKDFFLWICFRPEEKHNPTTHKLRTELDEAKLDYLMTFDGINFTDDKVPERIKQIPFKEKGAIILKEGYIYSTNDRLAKWYNPTSNQNYTIMFPNKTYYNPKKRLDYLDGLKTHEEVPEKFDCVELKDMYCSITHGNNMSTEWGHPFQREEIYNESIKNELLKNYV